MDWLSSNWALVALLVCVAVLLAVFSRGKEPKKGTENSRGSAKQDS